MVISTQTKDDMEITELDLWLIGLIAGVVIITFILLLIPESRKNQSSQTSVPSAQARYSDMAPQASNLGAAQGTGLGGFYGGHLPGIDDKE